jgi:tetratricopeptide (TPR) repeat protein
MKEGQVISLPPLQQDAAVEAFRCWGGMDEKSTSQIEQQAASDIVSDVRVKTLPLAIRRVAIYMKKTRLTCRMLRTKLEEKEKLRHLPESLEEILKASGLLPIRKILQQKGICQPEDLMKCELSDLYESCEITQEEQQTLKKVQESLRLDTHGTMHWDLDLEEVSKHSELAMDILNFCSLMESNAIPVEVLCKVTSPNNQDEFRQSLSFLVDDFSLISCDNDEGECSVHALIQESAVKRMTKLASLSYHCTRLSRCLNEMIPQTYDAIRQNVHSKNVMALTPHLYCLCDHILDAQCIEYDDVWYFVERCCSLATYCHDISTAKRLAERILCATKQSHKVTDSTKIALSLFCMGDVFTLMKQPELAKPYFEEAVHIVRKDGQATISPQLFYAALGKLASCHAAINELEEAERLQMELLEIMRRHKASDLEISTELNNLALTYKTAGNLKKAIAMYEESLELKRKSADVSPLELSTTVMNLGVCYKECGYFNKCVDLLNEAVKIMQSIYIYPHPSLALAVRHLGDVYFLLDDPNTPLHLASELLKKTPTSHRDFAEYMNTVGDSYFARGDYDSARSCYEKSSDWLRSNRPSALPQLATTLLSLANCCEMCNKLQESTSIVQEALKIRQSAYLSPHPKLAIAIRYLANVYSFLDDRSQPLRLAQELLEKTKSSLPQSHHDLPEYMDTVGYCYYSRGEYDRSVLWYEKSAQLLKSSHPTLVRQRVKNLQYLGICYRESGSLQVSVSVLDEAVTIARSCFTSRHLQLGNSKRRHKLLVTRKNDVLLDSYPTSLPIIYCSS